jgi:16S rRNA (cytidine1402-2'-O)-methyltransferase
VKKWRQTLFQKLVERKEETVIIYESVHRIIKTLIDIQSYFWDEHYVVVWRELTKKFEEFTRGNVSEVVQYFQSESGKTKWEFVVLF